MLANKVNVTFHVQDFDKSVAFYRDILGFSCIHSWDAADGRGAIFQLSPSSELEFFAPPHGHAQTEGQPKDMKVALLVDDVTAVYEQLRAVVPIVDPLGDRPWGDRSFGFSDPDGLIIYFFQRISSALADLA